MRYIMILTMMLCAAPAVRALPSDYQVIRSKPSDDLLLEVWLHKAHDDLYNLGGITYHWRTITNFQMVIEIPKDEYLCYAQMFDSANNAVPLRPAYKNLGKRFFDLKYPAPEEPWSDAIKDVLRMKPAHATGPSLGMGPQTIADFMIATPDIGGGRSFYNLDDVFKVEKAGKYKVRLQFQAYERIYKGGQSFAYKLERFEPVEFTVTKE